MGERIGYIRVSSIDQNVERQEVLMKELGATRIFKEKVSGKDINRIELNKMLDYIRPGDTVLVESYSRFSRSTKDLLNLVEEIKTKNVRFISHKENIDTTTPQGELMLTIFSGLVEFERKCLLERQKEGIRIAKANGKYKGKSYKEYDNKLFKAYLDDVKSNRLTVVKAMDLLGIKSKATYYKRRYLVNRYDNCNYIEGLI